MQIRKLVNDIFTIVRYHFQVPLAEDSVSYDRFLTHLRFFALRFLRQENTEGQQTDDFMIEQIKRKYQESYQCSEKIAKYIEKEFSWIVNEDEKVYLTLHIHRVTQRLEKGFSE